MAGVDSHPGQDLQSDLRVGLPSHRHAVLTGVPAHGMLDGPSEDVGRNLAGAHERAVDVPQDQAPCHW